MIYKIALTFQSKEEIKSQVANVISLKFPFMIFLVGSRSCRIAGSDKKAIVQSNRVPQTNRKVPKNMKSCAILLDEDDDDDSDDDDSDSNVDDGGLVVSR